jgi:hypothetical protein
MQAVPEAEVVVCGVVTGGGMTCVVAGGGGGGGAACVVVVGGGGALVAVWALDAVVTAALCAGFACGCAFGLGLAGLAVVAEDVVVVAGGGVDWVALAGVVAAAVWLELDEAEPHALTISVSRTAAIGMRRCLIGVSLTPRMSWLTSKDAARRGFFPGNSAPGASPGFGDEAEFP